MSNYGCPWYKLYLHDLFPCYVLNKHFWPTIRAITKPSTERALCQWFAASKGKITSHSSHRGKKKKKKRFILPLPLPRLSFSCTHQASLPQGISLSELLRRSQDMNAPDNPELPQCKDKTCSGEMDFRARTACPISWTPASQVHHWPR